MTYLEVLTDICAMLNDPNLDTYKDRAKDHFVRALTALISAGEYIESDIPGLYGMERDMYLGEALSENTLLTHAKWTMAGAANDFTDTGGALRWLYSGAGASTATQSAANRSHAGIKSYLYKLSYRVTVVTEPDDATPLAFSLGVFSTGAISLPYTAGNHTVYFTSNVAAPTADFVLSIVDTAGTVGELLIDNLYLEPAVPKGILKIDAAFIDPNNASAPDVKVFPKSLADIANIGGNDEMKPTDDELFIYQYGNRIYPVVSANTNFDTESDFVSLAYIKNVDDTNWGDTTDFQGDTDYLFSRGFVNKAITMAVATIKEETARE